MSTSTNARRRRGTTTESTNATGANVAVLRGWCANATERELPAGGRVVQFDVLTRVVVGGLERSAPVPVAWYDPPAGWSDILDHDAGVVVVGAVQRRFFRVGGATQSRTEVMARHVVPAARRREVRRALDGVVAGLA